MPKPLPVVEASPVRACCAPLADGPLGVDEATELADRLKALGDPHRLRLLSLLMASPERQLRTVDLVERLDLRQPTVTHHLRLLERAGLVAGERRGGSSWFTARTDTLSDLAGLLTS